MEDEKSERWELRSERCLQGCQQAESLGSLPWGTWPLSVGKLEPEGHPQTSPSLLPSPHCPPPRDVAREQVLKLTWARGKENASRGHRGKLLFSRLPQPLLLLLPLFLPPVTPFTPSSPTSPAPHPFLPSPLNSLTLEPRVLAPVIPWARVRKW